VARIRGHLYGTPRQPVEMQAWRPGQPVLLEIELEGRSGCGAVSPRIFSC